jgi:predicted lipoprotein with Yx(FWY)xxD motif
MTDNDEGSVTSAPRQTSAGAPRRGRAQGVIVVAVTALLAAGASFAAVALAAGGAATVGSASNASLGKRVTVNAQGRTLYALSPESTHHLLCTSAACLKTWPPVTVPSHKTRLKDGSGVHGRLGILRRSDGRLQVTLRGLPLYRFSGDHGKGEANGEGLQSFGGTWHAVPAAPGSNAPTPSATPTMPTTSTSEMPTTTTPTTTTPGYGY